MKIIAACMPDYESLIGINNTLPWPRLKADMQHFRRLTLNEAVIMGRGTYESIGSALPDRMNIIVSSTLQAAEGCHIVHSLREAIELARHTNKEPCVIGGARLFAEALMMLERKVYLTLVYPPVGWRLRMHSTPVFWPDVDLELKLVDTKTENGWLCRFTESV